MYKNIIEILEIKLNEGKVREETFKNMRLILNTEEKAENFLSYVKGMCNDCLELDCIAYRQLVLDNRVYDIEITKEKLKSKKSYLEKFGILCEMLLEDIAEEDFKEFDKLAVKYCSFTDNFLNFWDKRKGIPFSKLLDMYEKLGYLKEDAENMKKNNFKVVNGNVRKDVVYAMDIPIPCTTNIPKRTMKKWLDTGFDTIKECESFERKFKKGEYFINF